MAIELREFAERVLFGTTMEEKLSFPREEIVDTRPGAAIATPRALSRPASLALRENGVKASHPSVAKLVDERERGRLLHFFGNHELLATELMALAILKFPDAPASFRRGLLETLKDEQIHTRMYLHRMRQCGVEFGELPLSDYFWRSVSSMEDPLDYVTRLSLTFEQANLDYSSEYGKIFEQVGDSSTATILDKIYRDEIDHVGFGLKWFRRWKAAGKTDWEAYRERLHFPLSPARAKGDVFNAAGRLEVGFDAAFIEDLQVFKQSRGRTPSVLWFNPDAERFAALDGLGGAVDRASSLIQLDLGFLPAYFARRDDLLILDKRPGMSFLRGLAEAGFALPELMEGGGGAAPNIERKVADLRPWAWTPDSVAFFERTFEVVTRPLSAAALWNAEVRSLYSKGWSSAWGRELAEDVGEDWLAPAEVYGRSVESLDELLSLRRAYGNSGYESMVCKAPFGTAANGLRCLMAGEELTAAFRVWFEGVLETQGAVVAEPWLDRVFDFSVQLEKKESGVRVVGYARLINNARGQFRGIVSNGFCKGMGADLTRFVMTRIGKRPRLYHWYEESVVPRLEATLASSTFSGPMGIDAFVYRDREGGLKLKSVVEVNPRFTMGRVGLELGERVSGSSVGYFQILSRSQLRKLGAKGFAEYAENLQREQPVRLSGEARPRMVSGSLALTDPALATQFLAVFHVRERWSDLAL